MKFMALTGSKVDCLIGCANEWIEVNCFLWFWLWITGYEVKIKKG